jgi:hypothetical protein
MVDSERNWRFCKHRVPKRERQKDGGKNMKAGHFFADRQRKKTEF